MSTKQWYQVLLEDKVMMASPDGESVPTLITVRAETLSPSTDWPLTWKLSRTRGLGSELTAFLFKLIHCILPTQDRVSRLGATENLGICQHCHQEIEDLLHALFSCQHSSVAGHALLGYIQTLVPTLSPEAALRLEGNTVTNEDETWLLSTCLLLD